MRPSGGVQAPGRAPGGGPVTPTAEAQKAAPPRGGNDPLDLLGDGASKLSNLPDHCTCYRGERGDADVLLSAPDRQGRAGVPESLLRGPGYPCGSLRSNVPLCRRGVQSPEHLTSTPRVLSIGNLTVFFPRRALVSSSVNTVEPFPSPKTTFHQRSADTPPSVDSNEERPTCSSDRENAIGRPTAQPSTPGGAVDDGNPYPTPAPDVFSATDVAPASEPRLRSRNAGVCLLTCCPCLVSWIRGCRSLWGGVGGRGVCLARG